ncbi:3-phenylpropionate MFS transporter [Aeromonas rivuli]|jgi:MFS transporter, PPP family, 3-phenylpropionic acid transporter|uniref:3-phenylpropionate MFS transporter n=1 Tax=Aeromonas rivuli TaxID=648794 RepID=UPI001CCC6B1A|nr:3-phenylpropionate MFS transporter [Aeromonas rivuli]UBO74944.1 3-phenylpropionate MFS transporter [Aeromonas rivuli]
MPAFSWLALFFGAFYFVYGAYLPFWSLWLEGIGVSAEAIGMLLGAGMAIRFAGNLMVMGRIKGAAQLLPVTRLLCLLSLLAFLGFYVSHQLWWLVALTLVANFIYPTLMPMGEALATRMVLQTQLDYGKVRLCGSAAFILASTLVGVLITDWGSQWVLHIMVLGLGIMLLLSWLPLRPAPQDVQGERAHASLRDTLKSAPVRRFLLVTALLQGSHAAYYGFSAIHWKAAGYSGSTIGYLWALGVVAEIAMFAADKRYFSRFGAQRLFLIGAIGCLLRWSLLGASTEFGVLLFAQLLHGVSFCISHLGAVRFMTKDLAPEQLIPTQALYAALSLGITVATLMTLSGLLFEPLGGGIFFIMALVVLPVFVLRLKPSRSQPT